MVKYGYVVDLERCMGCGSCIMACKVENSTPESIFWMMVLKTEEGEYPNSRYVFYPHMCQHCSNPPCEKVCPTGARFKRDDGIVLTDFERCIGCRYCEVACPYGVNFFNWTNPKENYYHDWGTTPQTFGSGDVTEYSKGVVPPYRNPELDKKQGTEKRLTAGGGHFTGVIEKCTACIHRIESGLAQDPPLTPGVDMAATPACVANCPMTALHFGDLDDPDSNVSLILGKKRSFRLLEEKGTEPNVYYIGGTPPELKSEESEGGV